MKGRKKVVIASPREPCGATWLINCFLELGVLTYRGRLEDMWHVEGNKYFLKKDENILKKWLPSLTRLKHFSFQKNIDVEWVHEWPTKRFDNCQIIFYFRDPRDALYSRYRRESPQMSYSDFLGFLNPASLMDKVETFNFFTRCWMAHNNLALFRFEDYKKDPNYLLKKILNFIGIDIPFSHIEKAVKHSTSEQTALSEKLYRQEHPEDQEVINRGGIVGNWKNFIGSRLDASLRIESICGGLLTDLGYMQGGNDLINMSTYLAYVKDLFFFKNLKVLPKPEGQINLEQDAKMHSRVLDFASKLDQTKLECAKLYQGEIIDLILTLSEFLIGQHEDKIEHLERLHSAFSNKDNFYIELYKRTGKIGYLYHTDKSVLLSRILGSVKRKARGYLWV